MNYKSHSGVFRQPKAKVAHSLMSQARSKKGLEFASVSNSPFHEQQETEDDEQY
jgi:hypothetical protein